jgi:hypothetical protein
MLFFTRMAVASCLAAGLLTTVLLFSGALAATIGKSPHALGPCGPTLPPQARCGYHKRAVCAEWKSLVRGGKTFRCCTKWACWPKSHGQ